MEVFPVHDLLMGLTTLGSRLHQPDSQRLSRFSKNMRLAV